MAELEKLNANGDVADLVNSETDDDDCEEKTRGQWNNRLEYLLTLIGYTVGIGSVWRFPILCLRNGGGAFLIPFFLFLAACGGPLYYLEVCLGQFSGKSPIKAFEICPLFKGVGGLMVTVSFVMTWYYLIIIAWVLVYLVYSFFPILPWTTCDNYWNTPRCRESSFSKVSNLTWSHSLMSTVVNGTFVGSNVTTDIENITTETTVTSEETVSSAQEFWVNRVLGKSSGLDEFGGVQWHLAMGFLAAWLIVFLCLIKGVKSLGKVVYITATLPYILLTVVFVRGLTSDGAVDGIIVYLTPDFKKLLTAQVWVEAAIQVFYSLGPAWGGIITMSSYNKFHQKSLWSTVIVVVSDGFTAFYGGLVVFTVLGSMAKRLGVPVLDVAAASGPGLAFVVYPEAISTLPIPQFWAVLFFVTMVTMGIDTEFGMFETVTSALIDFFPGRLAAYRTTVTLVTAVSICILGIPFTCNGGVYLFQLCDWYFAAFALFLGASLETIMVCWIYGADRFSRDIEMMTGRKTSVVVRLLWCVICTFVLLVALVISLTQYSTPDYGDGYVYPVYGIVVGNIIAILPLLPLVGAIVWQIIRVQGSLIQRVKTLLRPTYHWQPNNNRCREIYKLKPYVYRRSFWQRMYTDLFGSKETPWF